MPEATPGDPRYQYEKFGRPSLTVQQLDELARFVFSDPPKNIVSAIITGIKLALALAYVAARERLIGAWEKIAQQEYEQERHRRNEGGLDRDDLDGQPRPGGAS